MRWNGGRTCLWGRQGGEGSPAGGSCPGTRLPGRTKAPTSRPQHAAPPLEEEVEAGLRTPARPRWTGERRVRREQVSAGMTGSRARTKHSTWCPGSREELRFQKRLPAPPPQALLPPRPPPQPRPPSRPGPPGLPQAPQACPAPAFAQSSHFCSIMGFTRLASSLSPPLRMSIPLPRPGSSASTVCVLMAGVSQWTLGRSVQGGARGHAGPGPWAPALPSGRALSHVDLTVQ